VSYVVAPSDTMRRVAANLGVTPERLEAAMKEAARLSPGDRVQVITR
jgi:hypothetical protein